MSTLPSLPISPQASADLTQFALDYPPQVTLIRSIETLTFDAVLSENHQSQLEVTTNPIETGVSIADHCFMQPLRCTIAAVVSDLKMPSGTNLYDNSAGMRARRAFEMLQALQTDCADGNLDPFSVSTGLRLYKDMVCVSITATQDAETAQLLSFEAQLQQVITVDTQQTTYNPPKPAAGKPTRQAGPTKDQGKEQPKKPDPATDSAMFDLLSFAKHPAQSLTRLNPFSPASPPK